MQITNLRQEITVNISNKTVPKSITKVNDATQRNNVITELVNRGIPVISTTAALANYDATETKQMYVEDIGYFGWKSTGVANGSTVYAGLTGFWHYIAPSKVLLLLDNVTNTSDTDKPVSTAQQTALNLKENASNKSTAPALGTSDVLFPTQFAVKQYVDNANTGLISDRGSYNASVNTFPATGGSGVAGAVKKGDLWYVSVAGTLGGTAVVLGDSFRALTDTPGQTAGNWNILATNIGFVPENSTNKDVDGTLAANSDVKYASQKATKTYVDAQVAGVATPTKAAIGLGNVDNTSDVNKPVSTLQAAAIALKENAANKSIDGTFAANSDTLFPSQKAVKTYVDANTAGLVRDRGNYNASGNTFPATGGSGGAGAVQAGDSWFISIAGTLGGVPVSPGDNVRALVNTPGQTAGNWSILEGNLGFIAENVTNKDTDGTLAANSDVKYPSQKAIKTYVTNVFAGIIAPTAASIGLGNVNNTSDANKPISTAQAAVNLTKEDAANKSTDPALGTSNVLFPTQAAVKSYVDGSVVGLLEDRGNFSAAGNVFPSTGGSGGGGAVAKGDLWYISAAGTLGGTPVAIGDSIRALVNTPGQTAGNWSILSSNLGFVPENTANKSTSTTLGTSNTLFPTQNAVKTYVDNKTAGYVVETSGSTSFTPVLADRGKYKKMTATTAITVTLPPNSSVAYTAGDTIMFEQGSTGQITFIAGAGVTAHSFNSMLKSAGQYAVVGAIYQGSDIWNIFGERTA